MSKNLIKGSLLATTVIAGMAFTAPAYAQAPAQGSTPVPAPAVGEPTPTDTQGNAPPAAPNAATPDAGPQSSESSGPAEPTSAKEIVVTGTLIRNPNLVASAPVSVVGQEEIRLKQNNVAEEVLRTIPGVVANVGSNVNNSNGGASFVDLRGLGPKRNLVLLDGARIVPADVNGSVDLNNIPLALVDRVDVLTGGASSTYGADAVSGVVNFITRSDFGGAELSLSDGITERGDGNQIRADLTVGANFDDGRGNAVLSIGYIETDTVYQGGDRPGSQVAIESLQAECIPCQGSATTAPSRIGFPTGGSGQVSLDGTTIAPTVYKAFNFNPYNLFQTPFTRYNLYSAGHYDITDHLTVYARGLYSNNVVQTIIAPSGIFGSAVTVNLNNPFLTAAQRSVICSRYDTDRDTTGLQPISQATCDAAGAATGPSDPNYRTVNLTLGRRTSELGPRLSHFETHIWDFRAGVRGDITDKIGFDVYGARGQSSNTLNVQNYVLTSRVRNALLANNTTSCISSDPGCVPLNVFGPEGSVTPEMGNYIVAPSSSVQTSRLSQIHGTVNGDIGVASPWAAEPISFALGAEYRKYKAAQDADVLAQGAGQLGGAGGATPPYQGALDVYEGFAETIMPIVSDRPFFQSLTVEAGIRRSHYTIDAPGKPQFNTTTWKIAGSWEPVDDLKFRGNYQRAVRAPNIFELFNPISTALTNLSVDPCAGAAPLNNANLAAICLAQGATPGQLGSIENPTAGQANVTGGGNPSLKPETATTYTFGAVFKPRFLPGFNATIDYYNIKIKDAITQPTTADMLAACFGADPANPPAGAASSPGCTIIRRNPNEGGLAGSPEDTPGLFGSLSNLGKLATDGIDVTANYRRNLGMLAGAPAKINLAFGGNYTHASKFKATPTSLNRECMGFYSANCSANNGTSGGSIQPKYSFNQRTTLSLGKVDLSLLWRYIHKEKYEPQQLADSFAQAEAANRDSDGNLLPLDLDEIGEEGFQACPNYADADPGSCVIDPQFRKIKSYNYFDFATRWNMNEHFDFTFTVANIFDKKPPMVGNSVGTTAFNSGNTYPATYDTLGRRFAAGARIKF